MPNDCPECRKNLPKRDSLRFCPFCGIDVLVTSCSECDEELDRSWKYCIACGTPAAA